MSVTWSDTGMGVLGLCSHSPFWLGRRQTIHSSRPRQRKRERASLPRSIQLLKSPRGLEPFRAPHPHTGSSLEWNTHMIFLGWVALHLTSQEGNDSEFCLSNQPRQSPLDEIVPLTACVLSSFFRATILGFCTRHAAQNTKRRGRCGAVVVWNSGDREYGGRNDYDHADARSLAQKRPLSWLG